MITSERARKREREGTVGGERERNTIYHSWVSYCCSEIEGEREVEREGEGGGGVLLSQDSRERKRGRKRQRTYHIITGSMLIYSISHIKNPETELQERPRPHKMALHVSRQEKNVF